MNWKPTTNNYYEVSDTGLVRSLTREVIYKNGTKATFKGKILKITTTPKGYGAVFLSNQNTEGYKTSRLVHRLVAEAFIPNPENKPQINHIDGDKLNNHVSNLEWVTNLENHIHKLENGLVPSSHVPKRVGKFTKEGELLETFNSIYAAAKSMNTRQWEISRCVNGQRATFKKFVWKYV
jgi:hypothetical protein